MQNHAVSVLFYMYLMLLWCLCCFAVSESNLALCHCTTHWHVFILLDIGLQRVPKAVQWLETLSNRCALVNIYSAAETLFISVVYCCCPTCCALFNAIHPNAGAQAPLHTRHLPCTYVHDDASSSHGLPSKPTQQHAMRHAGTASSSAALLLQKQHQMCVQCCSCSARQLPARQCCNLATKA